MTPSTNIPIPSQPPECAARKSFREFCEWAIEKCNVGAGDFKRGWDDGIRAALIRNVLEYCPCEELRAENERWKTLAAERLKAIENRYITEHYDALRARDLARETSNRDLEAKRAAEDELRNSEMVLEKAMESVSILRAYLATEKDAREKAELERDEWCRRDAQRINENGEIAELEHGRAENAEQALAEAVEALKPAAQLHADMVAYGMPRKHRIANGQSRLEVWQLESAAAFVAAHSKEKG